MIIKPYSDIAAETFVAADFPALKHFWACKDGTITAGGTVMDHVAGANLTIAAGAAASGNGLVLPVAAHAATSALTAPDSSPCLLIACGTWGGTGGLSYGLVTGNGGLSVGTPAAGAITFDGTNSITTSGTQTASQAFTRASFISASGGALVTTTMFEVNSSTLDVFTNTATLSAASPGALTAIYAVNQSVSIVGSAHTIFGVAFFKFTTQPPNDVIQAAAAWCDYQWRNSSNVTMYPGFKGIA